MGDKIYGDEVEIGEDLIAGYKEMAHGKYC